MEEKKFTLFEAKLEHLAIMTDPTHYLYKAHQCGDPIAFQYIEGLYGATGIKGTLLVTGDGLQPVKE